MMAKARDGYDRSGFCFNLCCVPSFLIRNIIRTGYGIHGGCCGDCLYTLLCPCCTAAQVSAEVKHREGAPRRIEMKI